MNPSQRRITLTTEEKQLENLLTEHEYAKIVNRSVASIRRDRGRGAGCPYVKLGGLVRYRPEDIRAYIHANARTSAEQAASNQEGK